MSADDVGTALFWGGLVWVYCMAFHWWTMKVPEMNWVENPDNSSHYNRRNGSHLNEVSGGDYGTDDQEAFHDMQGMKS